MKKLFFWFRILLSVSLMALLIYSVDSIGVTDISYGNQLWFILPAFCLGVGDRILMAYKWNILLKVKNIYISLKELTVTYLIAMFFGLFLPATVGADAVRAYAVAKGGHKTSDVISSIVVERVLGLAALLFFAMASIALCIIVFEETFAVTVWPLLWTVIVILAVFLILVPLSVNRSVFLYLSRPFKIISKYRAVQTLKEKIGTVYHSYIEYRKHLKEVSVFFLLSLLENMFPILWSYCLALALGIEISFLYFFMFIPLVLILRRIPISIDGIGVHQGAFVYFLSFVGIPNSQSLLLGIVTHLLTIIVILPGGLFYAYGGLRGRIERV